jgi:sortase A
MSYENTGQFKAVVEQLDDPLNDPLPGRAPAVQEPQADPGAAPQAYQDPSPPPYADPPPYEAGPVYGPAPYEPAYEAPAPPVEPAYPARPYEPQTYEPQPSPWFQPHRGTEQPAAPADDGDPPTAQMPALDDGPDAVEAAPEPGPPPAAPAPAPSDGGRAARRRAARQGGGHRAAGRAAAAQGPGQGQPGAQEAAAAPLSRVEARRAARAAKEGPAVIASRAVGELFITAGVLMLLFVTYQLWWTNVRAHREANHVTNNLQHEWDSTAGAAGKEPDTFSPGEGFAVMYIPKLDVRAPIAQGVSKQHVLDKGMIGHYDGALNTAMPWDKTGNFAVAAHRNTHGEPFRYINHLEPGDKVIVETANDYYTYVITSSLPSTPPSNISVLKPVPDGSGFTKPGRYLTLTTCTPEFQSTDRLIVWGKLVEDRPRSKGKPAALVDN